MTTHKIRFLLIVAACFTVGLFLNPVLMGRNAEAQKSQNESKAKTAVYEYCMINSISTAGDREQIKGMARICYLRESGMQCQDVEASVANDKPQGLWDRAGNEALAKAIAKLGEEGWELVGKGMPGLPERSQDALYFKRIRQ